MSLPACEKRALDAMDSALAASEPRLAAMFAMFARLCRDEGPIAAERLSDGHRPPGRPGAFWLLFPVLITMVLMATLLTGLAATLKSPCGGRAAAASLAHRPAASCVAPAQHLIGH